MHALPENIAQAEAVWNTFQSSAMPPLFHAVIISLGGLVILKGVRSIERLNLILIPSLVLVRSEEHTSELQSRGHLVCRLLLEKKIESFSDILHEYSLAKYNC